MWKQVLKVILKKEAIRLSVQVCIIFLSLFNATLLVASGIWRDSFQSLTEIGRGTLKVFVWEVYDLTLLSETNSFSWQNRFVLEFDYKLKLKKDEVIEASIKEMRHQRSVTSQALAKWKKYLERGIKTVEQGTRAAVEWLPEGKIAFHYENKAPVIIDDELFARTFISIWLGQETSEPELRAALLGQER